MPMRLSEVCKVQLSSSFCFLNDEVNLHNYIHPTIFYRLWSSSKPLLFPSHMEWILQLFLLMKILRLQVVPDILHVLQNLPSIQKRQPDHSCILPEQDSESKYR